MAWISRSPATRLFGDTPRESRPDIANRGTMTIGEGGCFASAPVPSHVIVGPGAKLVVGDRVCIGHGASIHAHLSVEIGDDVLIGPFAIIMDTDHHVATDQTGDGARAPIVVEPGARIGAHATLLRGCHVGAGAWVAAGSVVAGNVPAGARVAGNPAR